MSTKTKLLYSIFAVISGFLGFWVLCVALALIFGSPVNMAYRHRLIFLVGISITQLGIVRSAPVTTTFRVWLRAGTVATGLLGVGLELWGEISATQTFAPQNVAPQFKYIWGAVTVVFATMVGIALANKLTKQLHRRIAVE
jgi:hypothetical protein